HPEPLAPLRAQAVHLGSIQTEALVATQPQSLQLPPSGTFELYRVGDAMSSRDVHSAMLDAYRLSVCL
ncbi:MAG: hypothetical protein AAF438_22365, partial [Pseudomonadota bacterium]